MARNAPAVYGLTLDTRSGDLDPFFSTVDGIEGVAQDLQHRLSNDTVMGPGGEDWGINLRRLCGMPAAQIVRQGPRISDVIQRDDRIDSADVRVKLTKGTRFEGVYAGTVEVTAMTALGPFRRVFGFNDFTVAEITEILEGES